jgi:hypothetical protein
MKGRAMTTTRLLLLAAALLAAWTAGPLAPAEASAQQVRDEMNVCLCRNVLARTLCKSPEEFSYIDEYHDSGTYAFTVFYAKQETRFLCMVTARDVRIKGRAWQEIMRTIPYELNPETMCGVSTYSTLECPMEKPIVCCGEKSAQDLEEDKAYDFWSRPIPDILEDELKNRAQPPTDAAPGDAPGTAPGEGPAQP